MNSYNKVANTYTVAMAFVVLDCWFVGVVELCTELVVAVVVAAVVVVFAFVSAELNTHTHTKKNF
jgi:hypothetical protein